MAKSKMMTAAVYEGIGTLNIKEIPIPEIKSPDELLIKVEASGICGTDVRALNVPPEYQFNKNVVIGHEFAGIVEEAGKNVTRVQIGDRVVIHPNLGCGNCYYCRIGMVNSCENFIHLGDKISGGMAEYCIVAEKYVHKISKKIPPHIACLAEPLACVLNGTDTVRVHPGENVVVFGAGPIGMIYIMIYKAAGARVIVSDIAEKRLEYVKKIGPDYIFNSNNTDIVKEVLSITSIGADVVTDTVGILLDKALDMIKKGGDIVLFGINDKIPVELNQTSIVFNSVNIHGIYIAKGTFPFAVSLLENGILPMEKLISHRLPLKDIKKGIELMQKGEGVKIVIEL